MPTGFLFRAANLSAAYRVRHVGMRDVHAFPIGMHFANLEDELSEDGDEWHKRATLFKRFHALVLVSLF